jgi:chromate reductase, NAD(P)H dehydrogenase (quinone)
MTQKPITILGVPGSLRGQSLNRALIDAAALVAPVGVTVRPFLLHDVPPFNEDVEECGDPEPVRSLKAAIAGADGVLFATPQYNASIPGVVKNAVDWASRPPYQSVLAGKPVAVIGVTPGRSATQLARADLMRILGSLGAQIMEWPTVGVAQGFDHIQDGVVRSAKLQQEIGALLADFETFIRARADYGADAA